MKENYIKVKRWTKSQDIFEKDYVVIPINAFSHWFCVIILNVKNLLTPKNPKPAQIIYCDSMLEKRDFIVATVR